MDGLWINESTETNSTKDLILGSGCGTIGWAVASDTRDARFESQHLQKFISQL